MAVTLTNALLLALLVFILVLVIRTRKLFPVVVLAGAYSLVSAAMFVNLDAVDVAFTEAAVGQASRLCCSWLRWLISPGPRRKRRKPRA